MSVPQFDDLFNPILNALYFYGGVTNIHNLEQRVIEEIKLSKSDVVDIQKGTTRKISYRLSWARYYLKTYGLLEKLSRGVWGLTDQGHLIKSVDKEVVKRFVRDTFKNNESEVESAVEEEMDEYILREDENPMVEKEDNESFTIKEPFDPREIDIKTKQLMLKALFERIKYNEIDLLTDFQREGNLWDVTKQSRLIESILIRFPLPAFYFDGSDDNTWLIVDGLQRVSTLKNFVIEQRIGKERFKLQNLEFLSDFEGMTYDELPREMKRRIDETEITVYIISPGTPGDVKYNLFKRINTSGLVLKPQEIRHAINQGEPANFVKELAELEVFKIATSNSIKTNRMLDRDFVTRFIAFYLKGYMAYEPDLDSFLNKGMAEIKYLTDSKRETLKDNFIKSMNLSIALFGSYAFRKRYKIEDTKKPINKALFETWSVTLANVENVNYLINKKGRLIEMFLDLMNNNREFVESITSTTGSKSRVLKRFKEIEGIVKNI